MSFKLDLKGSKGSRVVEELPVAFGAEVEHSEERRKFGRGESWQGGKVWGTLIDGGRTGCHH